MRQSNMALEERFQNQMQELDGDVRALVSSGTNAISQEVISYVTLERKMEIAF